jgi:fatty acid desaturase
MSTILGLKLVLVPLLIEGVTLAGRRWGPPVEGWLSAFPMCGSAFAVHLLRGMVLGYYAFSVFCIVLSLALPAISIGLAFVVSLGCAVLVQAISRIHLERAQPVAPEPNSRLRRLLPLGELGRWAST